MPSPAGEEMPGLRAAARKLGDYVRPEDALPQLTAYAPKELTLDDVSGELESSTNDLRPSARLLLVLACLEADESRNLRGGGTVAEEKIIESCIEFLACVSLGRPLPGDGKPGGRRSKDGQAKYELLVAGLAMTVLLRLLEHKEGTTGSYPESISRIEKLPDEAFYSLPWFLDTEYNPSTTDRTVAAQAGKLLKFGLLARGPDDTLVRTLLQGYLRPLFSKSRPPGVTASGRKAAYADGGQEDGHRRGLVEEDAESKPWKYLDRRPVSVFSWVVDGSDEALISQHWPLFIPVLLTLADDPETRCRARGLALLSTFLARFPAKTLRDTGLGSVFEDAIFPTLLYLPSLTPEDESIQLLRPAYAALLVLARKQGLLPRSGGDGKPNEKYRLLDKVLREGVFAAYFHAREHVRIVEVLAQHTALVVEEMGLHAVQHLKDLIPMMSSIMTEPFAMSYPGALLQAVKALQSVILSCWPRLVRTPWENELIGAMVESWLNVEEDTGHESERSLILIELQTAADMFSAVFTSAGMDMSKTVEPLVAKEPKLRSLFGPR